MPRSRKSAAALLLVLALALAPSLSAAPLGELAGPGVRAAAHGLIARLRLLMYVVVGQSGCEMDPNGHVVCKP